MMLTHPSRHEESFVTSPYFAPAQPARGILSLSGEDRSTFLQGLVSNDMRKLAPDRVVWTALLTAQGKYLHDFFALTLGDTILLEGEGARIADLKKRLGLYKLRAKIALNDVSAEYETWLGWGGGAAAALGLAEAGQAAALGGGIAYVDPRRAALGIRCVLPAGQGADLFAGQGFVPGDWTDWERQRLSEGVPDGSRDLLPEKSILLENGFDELNGVAWDKGCYIGQELTARTKYRGLIKKRLMPVAITGALPEPGTLVTRPDGSEAGEIRSGLDGTALALIRFQALEAGGPYRAGDSSVEPLPPGWLQRPLPAG
jgi:tRNA-modifying protein YgfZ